MPPLSRLLRGRPKRRGTSDRRAGREGLQRDRHGHHDQGQWIFPATTGIAEHPAITGMRPLENTARIRAFPSVVGDAVVAARRKFEGLS